ncbi:transcription factor ETV7, partial [Schistocerca piceifrons]|uniref:transcription factor ETV7 n=1 Tax=Schistocerca piceifrons TaxID=274613 RepID=UPI001F5F4AF4
PFLPKDPRSWSREHVSLWLQQMQAQHGLPHVAADRFLMNGKALCLMTVDMFLGRVPLGGKLLYKDFQLRLGRAMHSCS